MIIEYSFGRDFDKLWSKLQAKYPQALFDLEGVGKQLDSCRFAKDFFSNSVTADSSIDPNANVEDNSIIVYNTESDKPSKKLNSFFVLWKKLEELHGKQVADTIIEMQISGDIYIHDAHGISAGLPYCFNYSCYDLMTKGLSIVTKIDCLPPKYFTAFKSQLEQFTVIASNSTLGATGLADMLVCMSYYVKNMLSNGSDSGFFFDGWFSDGEKEFIVEDLEKMYELDKDNEEEIDKLVKGINAKLEKTGPANKQWFERNVYKYVRENLVSFVYTVNQPMRANQSPFTNVSVYDDNFLAKLTEDYIFADGSVLDIELVKKLQVLFIDSMNRELRRNPLTFPVTTACFSVNKNGDILDTEFLELISEKNMEFAFINIYCGDSSTLSSCCRLRSETKGEYFNSFGSGSSKIGSLGVCSINFPRLAYKNKDIDKFTASLEELVRVCAQVNNAKREVLKERINNGNEPLYTEGFMELSKQYSTAGVNGLHECVELLGYDILTEEGTNLTLAIIDVLNRENDKYQILFNAPHNCEQVPGETMSVKMAKKDALMGFNLGDYELYSNQFIPLTTNADMLDRLKLQGTFDKHFSGGSICHLNVENRIEDPKQMAELIVASASMGVIYFAINYNLQKCEDGHMTISPITNRKCTICGKDITDDYTRVVGFLTNSKNWHKVRREKDRPNRVFYEGIENVKIVKATKKKKGTIIV